MRPEPNHALDKFRQPHPTLGDSLPGTNWGYFKRGPLHIISSGAGQLYDWEHVSVSTARRCPTWHEMKTVKEMFWGAHETVVQFHPAAADYVDAHPNCLHLWKRTGYQYALPPRHLV